MGQGVAMLSSVSEKKMNFYRLLSYNSYHSLSLIQIEAF